MTDQADQTNKQIKTYTEALEILTPREVEVLKLAGKGLSNTEIAANLHLSVRTIHKHRGNICKKIGVNGRLGLVKWFWRVRNGDYG